MCRPGSTHLGAGTSSTVNVGGNEVETTLSFTTGTQLWNDFATAGVMTVQFASAICANDIIVGSVAKVPEPSTLFLAGLLPSLRPSASGRCRSGRAGRSL